MLRRAARNMASVVADLQRNPGSRAVETRAAGNLWMEVNRLKREGQNLRMLEWQLSELEENLRANRQDDVSRRHRLNNLTYEIEALRRRNR